MHCVMYSHYGAAGIAHGTQGSHHLDRSNHLKQYSPWASLAGALHPGQVSGVRLPLPWLRGLAWSWRCLASLRIDEVKDR